MTIKIMSEEALIEDWPNLITMEEKGYPINHAQFYVKYIGDIPVGHICYKDMGNWHFIGNSYVKEEYRGQGVYDELMCKRNSDLSDKNKIAMLIPIENSQLEKLETRIKNRNYIKVNTFLDVYGIMSFLDYFKFRKQNMWLLKCQLNKERMAGIGVIGGRLKVKQRH